jgi:hypothetical protein
MEAQRQPELTMEQSFKLEVLKSQIKHLTKEQAQEYLVEVFQQMMVKDNLMLKLFKNI